MSFSGRITLGGKLSPRLLINDSDERNVGDVGGMRRKYAKIKERNSLLQASRFFLKRMANGVVKIQLTGRNRDYCRAVSGKMQKRFKNETFLS